MSDPDASPWLNLPSMPYAERQRIVVSDDAVVDAERRAMADAERSGKGVDWTQVASVAGTVAISVAGGLHGVTLAVGKLAYESVKALAKARQQGLDILSVSRSEADALVLPPGHPRDLVVYVGHPAIPRTYFPAAAFHRLTFEHKFAEAIRILMALGATELEVEHVHGWAEEFASELTVGVPSLDVQLGAKAGQEHRKQSAALFRASLAGAEEPSLPKDLVWFSHEPTWQQIAEGRLKYGLKDFQLTVRYDDDYGINAGFKLSATKVGLDLGGNFQDHLTTTWKVTGTFAK